MKPWTLQLLRILKVFWSSQPWKMSNLEKKTLSLLIWTTIIPKTLMFHSLIWMRRRRFFSKNVPMPWTNVWKTMRTFWSVGETQKERLSCFWLNTFAGIKSSPWMLRRNFSKFQASMHWKNEISKKDASERMIYFSLVFLYNKFSFNYFLFWE